jgi:hypothetical protein
MHCPNVTIKHNNQDLVFKLQEVTMVFKFNGIINNNNSPGDSDKHAELPFIATGFIPFNHNLNKFPSISVIDSSKTIWMVGVQHIDNNNCIVDCTRLANGVIIAN